VAYVIRLLWLLAVWQPQVVFIQKRLLPPILIRAIGWLSPNLVFDFDDAIYLCHAGVQDGQKPTWRSRKELQRLEEMLRRARRIIVGNQQLAKFALQYSTRVSVLSTPVDTLQYSQQACAAMQSSKTDVTIGWIGSSENMWYVRQIGSALQQICAQYPHVSIKIVSDGHLEIPGVRTRSKRWALLEEIEDLCTFDIGIMPLTDDEWSRGKCAFKVLLYMAMGLPVVCSPVAMNRKVVQHGINGLFASSVQEWVTALEVLIQRPEKRLALGQAGQRVVQERYALTVLEPRLFDVLVAVAEGK
jgi:glycosyltransferase involved in cell wall biosynthesis